MTEIVRSSEPPANSGRSRTAKGHKPNCVCKVCLRIQAAIAAGKPPKAETREKQRLTRIAKAKAKQELRRAEVAAKAQAKAKVKSALASKIEGVVLGQVAAGIIPSASRVAEMTGASLGETKQVMGGDFVQSALARAGITDDKLAQVAAEGLEAKNYRYLTDRDGNIVDVIEMPDHQNRHRFWRDLLMVKGYLGSDREQVASGGLMIIVPEQARVVKGHPPTCTCDECIKAWNDRTREMSARALKAMTIDAEISSGQVVENPNGSPSVVMGPSDFDDETQ